MISRWVIVNEGSVGQRKVAPPIQRCRITGNANWTVGFRLFHRRIMTILSRGRSSRKATAEISINLETIIATAINKIQMKQQ